MEKNNSLLLLASIILLLSSGCDMVAEKSCGYCGPTPVPYPLSTGPNCGDQYYKIRCVSGVLWFDALYGTSYLITFINPETRRFEIRPDNNVSVGFQLNASLPFHIAGSNTIIYFNCTNRIRRSPLDCTDSSFCYTYIRDKPELMKKGLHRRVCCTFRTGGSASSTAYTISVRQEGCRAYRSFLNLDASLPVSKWPAPGMEIEWLLPCNPVCRTQTDCDHDGEFDSTWAIDPTPITDGGQRRCFCNAGLRWDAVAGLCDKGVTCQTSGGCDGSGSHIPPIIVPLICGLVASAAPILTFIAFKRWRNSGI